MPIPRLPRFELMMNNGQLESESWRVRGKPHNPTPLTQAERTYHPNGQLAAEAWFEDGRYHDPVVGIPAVRIYHPNGQVRHERHYRNGNRQAPGTSAYRSNGQSMEEELLWERWWFHGGSKAHSPNF